MIRLSQSIIVQGGFDNASFMSEEWERGSADADKQARELVKGIVGGREMVGLRELAFSEVIKNRLPPAQEGSSLLTGLLWGHRP